MDTPIGWTLVLIAVVCLVSAAVGGNVSLPGGVKFGRQLGKRSRAALALLAIATLTLGAVTIVAQRPETRTSYAAKANAMCIEHRAEIQLAVREMTRAYFEAHDSATAATQAETARSSLER